MIPTVSRHPLRHAAARGRVAARHRRGRRPGHLRLQVPRRRPGARGCWSPRWSSASSPGMIGLDTPRLVALDLDPEIARYEADEEVQDLLNASAGLNLGVDFLPGRVRVRRARCRTADGRRGRPGAVARRLRAPTSTAAGATPTCWSGTATSGSIDHGASLYFHHAWPAGLGDPARFAAQPWDVAGHVLRGTSPRRRLGGGRRRARAPGSTEEPLARGGRRGARRLAGAGPAPTTPSGCARRTSPSSRPGSGARAVAAGGGGGMSSVGTPTSTSCCGACPRATARSSSTSAWCSTAGGRLPRRRLARRRGPAARAGPAARRRPGAARRSTFVDGVCAGDPRAGAAAEAAARARGSASSRRRAAPCSSPGPVHGGLTADPARQLEHLLERLVGLGLRPGPARRRRRRTARAPCGRARGARPAARTPPPRRPRGRAPRPGRAGSPGPGTARRPRCAGDPRRGTPGPPRRWPAGPPRRTPR